MNPYDLIFDEHRIIERVFPVITKQIENIKAGHKLDPAFIDAVTDLFITYIDISHHGKEENLLFNALNKKKLSAEHKKMMNILLDEHKQGRHAVEQIIKSNQAYQRDGSELNNIIARLNDFVTIYAKHIEKEDNDFFKKCMYYFSEEEQKELVQKFWRFDIQFIQEKYKKVIEMLGKHT